MGRALAGFALVVLGGLGIAASEAAVVTLVGFMVLVAGFALLGHAINRAKGRT